MKKKKQMYDVLDVKKAFGKHWDPSRLPEKIEILMEWEEETGS